MWNKLVVVTLLLTTTLLVKAASFSGGLTLNTNNPPIFSKLEVSFQLGDTYDNHYDTSEIEVHVNYTSPSGTQLYVPCFPFQQYTPTSNNWDWPTVGSMNWLCRFSPVEVGDYKFVVTATDQSSADWLDGTFTSANSSLPGFIQRSSQDNRYLVRSNTKETVFAIGENIAWWNNGIHDYDNWVGRLGDAGGNFFRLWIGATQFAFAIEENIGNYDSTQDKAAFLDYLIEMAESKGITIQLCLNFHGDFSTTVNSNWAKNPYNSANGGPLNDPQYVWTDQTTINYFERRYRYTIARWGYSTAVHAWELWNEMDWINNYSSWVSQAASWHQQFYDLIHVYDPHGHVITTSFAEDQNDQPVNDVVDYTQIHIYNSQTNIPDFVQTANYYIPNHLSTYNSPVWLGEMGVSWEDGKTCVSWDPNGIALHNVQWSSLVNGGCGGGFSWWWDSYVDPQNLYGVYTGISQFLQGVSLDSHQFTVVQPGINNDNNYLRGYVLSGADGYVIGWIQAQAYTWYNVYSGGGIPTVSNAGVQISCDNSANNNTLEIWNTFTGSRISYNDITCDGGSYNFNLPTIDGNTPDYAFKIYPGGPQNHTNPPTTPPTNAPPNTKLPDWAYCSQSNQCQDNCCSLQYSSDDKLKCTPGGSSNMCVTGSLADWDFCTVSSACADGCCSKQYSSDGNYKCTPGGSVDQCI